MITRCNRNGSDHLRRRRAIGGAVARAFAREGARIFLSGRNAAPVECGRRAVIAFLASKPASYVTVSQYTMGGEWKRGIGDCEGTSIERGTEGNER